MVNVQFFAAGGPCSGVELSGTFGDRILSFYGPTTFGEPILQTEAQDLTWITNNAGVPLNDDGGPLAQSGQCANVKWVSASQYSLNSGVTASLPITASGNATVWIKVTDTGNINISGAKLYAYDGTNVNNNPSGVWVLSAEVIDPQGGMSGNGDTQWALIDSTNYNYMVDRTQDVGYPASGEFHYFVALSVRPKLTATQSGLQTFGLRFSFDYS